MCLHLQAARNRALAAFSRHLEEQSPAGDCTEQEVQAAKAELHHAMQKVNQALQCDRKAKEKQHQQHQHRQQQLPPSDKPKETEVERCNAWQCKGITRRGERCRNGAKAGSDFCGRHAARA